MQTTHCNESRIWKEDAMSEKLQKCYYKSQYEKLLHKVRRLEGDVQDLQCDNNHLNRVNDILRSVIIDK
jgi:hypothetical protein